MADITRVMKQPGVRDLLQILEQDAHTTPDQMAERTGLPKRRVTRLVRELEAAGVIRKYKAVVAWERTGAERVYAFIEVRVTPERGRGFDAVAERILRFPEVHSLYLMSGAYDLHVVAEGGTMREVALFVAEKLATIEGVQSTATHFVLRRYKVDGDILEQPEQAERLPISM
ncbi:MAG TPA: Lrp/AsnC family transcriptional regulator [Armatimonadota bacterium]|nr:Lrp/AsnC family transcriptional regulator [Armatimonadota bacterium]